MAGVPEYEKPMSAEKRRDIAKWLLIWIAAFTVLLIAAARSPYVFVIAPILALPGFPLLYLALGDLPYQGQYSLMIFVMAPWLAIGLPAAVWAALKLRQNRFLSSVGIAALLFPLWSFLVQIAFLVRYPP